MGATSARKAAQVLVNSEHALAIELLAAAQGIDLRAPLAPAAGTGAALEAVRSVSPTLEEDRSLAADIGAVRSMYKSGALEAKTAAAGILIS